MSFNLWCHPRRWSSRTLTAAISVLRCGTRSDGEQAASALIRAGAAPRRSRLCRLPPGNEDPVHNFRVNLGAVDEETHRVFGCERRSPMPHRYDLGVGFL